MAKIDLTNVSSSFFAECIGMTRDGVTRLARAGVITQNGRARGKYNIFEALPQYLAHIRALSGAESADTRLAIQRERKLRLQNDKLDAALVPVQEVAKVFAAYASMFREIVNSQLEHMADHLADADTPHGTTQILQDDIQATVKMVTDEVLSALE